MKTLINIILIVAFTSLGVKAQNTPRPNIAAPQGLSVNSFTGNLFYQRNEQSLRGTGFRIYQTFYYNAAQDTLNYGYGKGWSFYYNVFYKINGDSLTIQHADAKKDVFIRKDGKYIQPAGVNDVLTKNGEAYVLTAKDGQKQIFGSADHKKLTRIEDANGNFLNVTYADGYPVKITNSTGRNLVLEWESGVLKTAKDQANADKKYTYAYNQDKDLISVTDPMGAKKTFVYKKHFLIGLSDENGNPVAIDYLGGSGRVKQIISCNTEQKFSFLDSLKKTFVSQKGATGTITNGYFFDKEGRLIALTDPDNNKVSFTYDVQNNLTSSTDIGGRITRYTYDARGNVLSETDASGSSIAYTYDALYNKPLTQKDKKGNLTTFSYDAKGNLKSIAKPGGATESYTYDAAGRKLSTTNANNSATTYQYNGDGDLIKTQYPIGAIQYQYNGSCCDVGSITDANGNTISMTYDLMGRKTSIKDSQGNTTSYEYDGVGNVTKETDPNGNVKKYTYDGLNHLASVTISAGTWVYAYDSQGNMIKMTDANAHSTDYTYNNKNQLTRETDPLGKSTGYQYDVNGNLTARTDPNGNTVNYQYDNLDRLTAKSYNGNTDKFDYDEAGNMIGAYNNNMAYTFDYDNQNRLLRKNIVTWGKTISYTYDGVGNRKTMTDHDGGKTTYEYDQNNRLTTLTNAAALVTRFEYDAGGRITKQNNGNGTFATYHYNEAGQMDALTNWKNDTEKISFFNYTFDKYGNRKTMTDKRGLHTYTYDASHRLTGVVYADGTTESFSIDGTGNRTQRVKNGVPTAYTYNSADQIQTAGTIGYVFDANGNTIQQKDSLNRVFKYDGENRLLEVELDGKKAVTYKYDPFGDKIEKQDEAAVVTRMLYDGSDLLGELSQMNATKTKYTTALGMDNWLSSNTNNKNYFFQKDGLNSTIELTDLAGETINEYQYDVYGNISTKIENAENVVLYTGRILEKSISLYDYRARFYDAKIGRFKNKDLVDGNLPDPTSQNKYNYVEGDPVNFFDQIGESKGRLYFQLVKIALKIFANQRFHTDRNDFNEKPTSNPNSKGNLEGWRKADDFDNLFHQKNMFDKKSWDRVKYLKESGDEMSSEAIWDEKLGRWLDCGEKGGPTFNYFDPKGDYGTLSGLWNRTRHAIFDVLPHLFNDEYKCPPKEPTPGSQDPIAAPPGQKQVVKFPTLAPSDPNEIVGNAGFDSLRKWVSPKQTLQYKIYFENDPEFATAPAQKVNIYAPIEGNINPGSFRVADFGFGSFNFTVPQNTSIYSTRLDLRDSLGIFLDVTAGLDVANKRAFWSFDSIDPATGLSATLPADKGFLLVNDSLTRRGEGYVNFAALPISSVKTQDEVTATASIIFDDEETINTNIWKNTIDAVAPTSKINTSTTTGNQIKLIWSGKDDEGGTGVKEYNLYVSKNSEPYVLQQSAITETEYTFEGATGTQYAFFVTATDMVGNVEALKKKPDLEVLLGQPKIAQSITFAAITAKNYGDADFELNATTSSALPVTYTSADTRIATIIDNNKIKIIQAGTVMISATQAGNDIFDAATVVAQQLVINKKELTVTANNQTRMQHENNPLFTFNYSGFVTGENESVLTTKPTATTTATADSPLGEYPINVNGGAALNYAFNYVAGKLTITKTIAPLVFMAIPVKTYGDADFDLGATSGYGELSYTISNTRILSIVVPGRVTILKPGTVTIQVSDGRTTAEQTLVINKAMLTVTAKDYSRNYNQDNPAFELTYAGFVNGDNTSQLSAIPVGTTVATRLSAPGTFAITPVVGSPSDKYNFTMVNGTLTISKAEQLIVFDALTARVYGDADFGLTATSSAGLPITFVSDHTDIVNINGVSTAKIIKGGTVNITASNAGNQFYLPASVTRPFLIGKAALTLIADAKNRPYQTPNPEFTFSYRGLVNGDTKAPFTVQPIIATTATLSSNIGNYPISISGASSDSYSFTFTNNILSIAPAVRSFTFGAIPAKVFNDPDFDAGAQVNSGETITYNSSDNAVATVQGNKIHIVGTGQSTLTATILPNANYTGNLQLTQVLTVNKAPQTISFEPIPLLKRRGAAYVLQVSSNSGLPVELSLSDKLIATLNSTSLSPLRIGSGNITAVQNGNNNYLPATKVIRDFKITDEENAAVKVSQAVSVDGDGINDFLVIEGIKDFPDNQIVIVNRNGSKVFEISRYDNVGNAFNGKNNKGENLPVGTYYYILTYQRNGVQERETGYFILKF